MISWHYQKCHAKYAKQRNMYLSFSWPRSNNLKLQLLCLVLGLLQAETCSEEMVAKLGSVLQAAQLDGFQLLPFGWLDVRTRLKPTI